MNNVFRTWQRPQVGQHGAGKPRANWFAPGASLHLLVGFLAGLIVGLPILGWWLWPARVANSLPVDLAPPYQEAYVAMVADSYALSGDLALAAARLSAWQPAELQAIIERLVTEANEHGNPLMAARLEQLRDDLGYAAKALPGESPTQQAPAAARSGPGLAAVILGLLLLAVGLGGLGFAYLLLRRRGQAIAQAASAGASAVSRRLASLRTQAASRSGLSGAARQPAPTHLPSDEDSLTVEEASQMLLADRPNPNEVLAEEPAKPDPSPAASAQPAVPVATAAKEHVGTYLVTYRHGPDEPFDTSFSIEAEDGEFLGECGVGVAENIGDAVPERACAMEVWLFDKSDIHTPTKVLASEQAIRDAGMREILLSHGEVVPATPGQTFTLETADLLLEVEVMSCTYGAATDTPAQSFFQELDLELRAYRKR